VGVGLKIGRIVADTTPPTREARIVRFKLDSGKSVHVPAPLASALLLGHPEGTQFYFVEKGLLGRVSWAGPLEQLHSAVAEGTVSRHDLRGFVLPAEWRTDRPPPSATGHSDLDMAISDPIAAYEQRFRQTLGLLGATISRYPGLPNPMARNLAVATGQLDLEDWELVRSIAHRSEPPPSRLQGDIWRATEGAEVAKILTATWTAAQMAFELVVLGTIHRQLARCAEVRDGAQFDRWDAIQRWWFDGGTGILNQCAGYLATQPYSSIDLEVVSMLPLSEVLPIASYAGLNRAPSAPTPATRPGRRSI
jgi:hypothetical protein